MTAVGSNSEARKRRQERDPADAPPPTREPDRLTGDTPERVREYLKSGDEFEVIQTVYEEAQRLGQTEIWSSEIEEIR